MPYSTSVPPWWPRDDRFPRSPRDLEFELHALTNRLSVIDHFMSRAEGDTAEGAAELLLPLQLLRRSLADAIGALLTAQELTRVLQREEPRP